MFNSEIDRISIITISENDNQDFLSDLDLNDILKPSTTEKNIENALKGSNYQKDDDNSEFGEFGLQDDNNSISKSFRNFISKKTERNDNDIDNYINLQINLQKDKTINNKKSNKTIEYRHDYYIKKFKTVILKFLKRKLNELIDNIKLCIKFSKHKIHAPNRKLYGGNSKKKDNKEFIYKTVEKIFIDQGEEEIKEDNSIDEKEVINLQKKNEQIFNKIKKGICLNKSKNSEIYKEQSEAVKKLITYLQKTIKEILFEDEFYNSDEFGEFRSNSILKKYDDKFKKERNSRNLSLLEKYNFVNLVENGLI